MICVYWSDITGLEDRLEEQLNKVSQQRREKIEKLAQSGDKARSLGGGLLMEQGLTDFEKRCGLSLFSRDKEGKISEEYVYGIKGKPYFKNIPNIHFSLSHSGNLVMLAVGDVNVGVDVQKMQGYKEGIVKRFYHKKEVDALLQCETEVVREAHFYEIWTYKEAYIKYTGNGLSEDFRTFYAEEKKACIVRESGQAIAKYYQLLLRKPEYKAAVVFDKNTKNIVEIVEKVINI